MTKEADTTDDVEGDDGSCEDGDPDTSVDVRSPVADDNGSRIQLFNGW